VPVCRERITPLEFPGSREALVHMRVYELAKELGIDSRTLMRYFVEIGEFARSASSPLEPPVVRKARHHFGGASASGSIRPTPSAPEPPEDVYSEAERLFGRPVPRPRAPRPQPARRPASFSTPLAEPGKSIPSATDRYDMDWARRLIPPDVRSDFIAAGLDTRSAPVVEQCLLHGITAADLHRRVDGIRVAQRLRNREPIASIAARLREARGD